MEESSRKWAVISVAGILALGMILSSLIVSNSMVKLKMANNTITVTGSAKQQIKSDLSVWTGNFTTQSPQLSTAFNQIKSDQQKIKDYLKNQGINEKDMVFSSINTEVRYATLPNGQYSTQVEGYRLHQQVEIRSPDVDKITELSRQTTDLINQGVEFQSNPPQYFYTKIADMKVKMLSLATKDAMVRAEQIASNAGSRVGALRAARMGVFQITPLYSNEVSDYGINDTSSLEKEITAVMNCEFEIKR
ncbi:Uncharacterised conserved protein UCP029033, periplasmic protein [Syntrophomonas zehnderi OL-4]|uniref:Uncharacterized conserved protein UCP029033, periplasmic protein n=1 Tax=Syntrophomonas zehnderi OL-4 TaxID=690567 RepID=A0A0E3W3A9_9FIRM|nr:SIMPL domain-containing protein [Syntrophomonas zehnderi]CFX68439.1 Uncharacterised conserved protein UCP029033, periplasmic protein [Syntrophomonas zehnderi OL-4]